MITSLNYFAVLYIACNYATNLHKMFGRKPQDRAYILSMIIANNVIEVLCQSMP